MPRSSSNTEEPENKGAPGASFLATRLTQSVSSKSRRNPVTKKPKMNGSSKTPKFDLCLPHTCILTYVNTHTQRTARATIYVTNDLNLRM